MKPDFYVLAEKFLSSIDVLHTKWFHADPVVVDDLARLLSTVYEDGVANSATRPRPAMSLPIREGIISEKVAPGEHQHDWRLAGASVSQNTGRPVGPAKIALNYTCACGARKSDEQFNGVDRTQDLPPNPAPGSGGFYGAKVRDGE